MEFTTITYKRPARFKIDLAQVPGLLKLREQGESLRDLQGRFRTEFGMEVSIPTISRAIKRAEAKS